MSEDRVLGAGDAKDILNQGDPGDDAQAKAERIIDRDLARAHMRRMALRLADFSDLLSELNERFGRSTREAVKARELLQNCFDFLGVDKAIEETESDGEIERYLGNVEERSKPVVIGPAAAEKPGVCRMVPRSTQKTATGPGHVDPDLDGFEDEDDEED